MNRDLREWIITILVAVVLAFVLRQWVVATYRVDGHSMLDTLHDRDWLVVDKITYQFSKPRFGDIVVLRPKGDLEKNYVKRVIGVSGDQIELKNQGVYRNGKRLVEPYAQSPTLPGSGPPKFTVPNGYIFVMGDNRPNSSDSRNSVTVGYVALHSVEGRARAIIWPPNRIRVLLRGR